MIPRRDLIATVVLGVLLGVVSAAEAAITIKSAAVQFGVAVVEGRASPNADIFWEGNPVTQANSSNGGFKVFGVVPADCMGTLEDGTTGDIEDVALDDCDPDGSGGSGAPAPVAVTGQDGDIQAGVLFPSPCFTDNSNGTVTDNLTGLIWLKNGNCFGPRSWQNALNAANGLADDPTDMTPDCGLSDGSALGDWRLPNVKELQSLIDFGNVGPALPSDHPFSDVRGGGYWSSTTIAVLPHLAWGIRSADAGTVVGRKDDDGGSVWPVPGGNRIDSSTL